MSHLSLDSLLGAPPPAQTPNHIWSLLSNRPLDFLPEDYERLHFSKYEGCSPFSTWQPQENEVEIKAIVWIIQKAKNQFGGSIICIYQMRGKKNLIGPSVPFHFGWVRGSRSRRFVCQNLPSISGIPCGFFVLWFSLCLKGLKAEQSWFELHNHPPVTWFVSASNSLKPTLWHSFYIMFSLNSTSVVSLMRLPSLWCRGPIPAFLPDLPTFFPGGPCGSHPGKHGTVGWDSEVTTDSVSCPMPSPAEHLM